MRSDGDTPEGGSTPVVVEAGTTPPRGVGTARTADVSYTPFVLPMHNAGGSMQPIRGSGTHPNVVLQARRDNAAKPPLKPRAGRRWTDPGLSDARAVVSVSDCSSPPARVRSSNDELPPLPNAADTTNNNHSHRNPSPSRSTHAAGEQLSGGGLLEANPARGTAGGASRTPASGACAPPSPPSRVSTIPARSALHSFPAAATSLPQPSVKTFRARRAQQPGTRVG